MRPEKLIEKVTVQNILDNLRNIVNSEPKKTQGGINDVES